MDNKQSLWKNISELYFPGIESYVSPLITSIPELNFMANSNKNIDFTVKPSLLKTEKESLAQRFCDYFFEKGVTPLVKVTISDLNIFCCYDADVDSVVNYFYYEEEHINPLFSQLGVKIQNISDIWKRYNAERKNYSLEIKDNSIPYNQFLTYLNCKLRIKNNHMSFIKVTSGLCKFCDEASFLEIDYDGAKILSCLDEDCLFKNCFELGFCCYLQDGRVDFFSIPPSPLSTRSELANSEEEDDQEEYYVSSVETSTTTSEEIDTRNIKLEYSNMDIKDEHFTYK